MFGKNPVRKSWMDPEGRLAVQAVFATIQGEGPYAGQPATFVRLAGCNLRCWFCDTDFESNIENVRSVSEVVAQVEREALPGKLIVLTGGEPLRQNIIPLLDALEHRGFRVQIETAGTLWVDSLELFVETDMVELVCSPKTPTVNEKIAEYCSHYKYIIAADDVCDHDDGLPFAFTQANSGLRMKPVLAPAPHLKLFRPGRIGEWKPSLTGITVWVQPCDEGNETRNKRNRDRCVELAMRHGYRVSLQQHKILNVD